MKISEKGLKLIKEFEGCHLTAYRDPVGIWTIGYGVTNSDKSITGKTIKPGMKISQATADEWLKECLERKYMPLVMKYDYQYHWNVNEANALLSFCYNIGSIKQLTADGTRSRKEIASKMLEYNKAGGRVFAGLTRRRKAERALFLTPVEKEHYPGKYPDLPPRGWFQYGDGYLDNKAWVSNIKKTQKLINWALGTKLTVDGHYGDATTKAVMKMQGKFGLDKNGKFGKLCLAKCKALKK